MFGEDESQEQDVPATKRRIPRFVWWVIGLLAIVALGAILFSDLLVVARESPGVARALGEPIAVRGERVRRERIELSTGAAATVEPIASRTVPSRITGVIEDVYVEEGQLVHRGDLLAKMEPYVPQANLDAAQADVDSSKAEMEIARLQHERMQKLFDEQIAPQVDLELAQLKLELARSRHGRALKELEKARVEAELGLAVTAPVTGVIEERLVNPGEAMIANRQDFFSIGEIDPVAVVAAVAEERIGTVQGGQTATVLLDAFPDREFEGEVFKISPQVDPKTRTFNVYLKVANPDLLIKPGQSGFVHLRHDHFGLTIPRLALLSSAGQASVFVLEGDRARLRPVKARPASLGRVLVSEGLKENEIVLYYETLSLEDNTRVRLEAEPR